MFNKITNLAKPDFLACTFFDLDSKTFEIPSFNAPIQKGIHIGLEVENKKAIKGKVPPLFDDSCEDEWKGAITPSTLQNTPKLSDRHRSISQEIGLSAKRKRCPLLEGCNDIENYSLLNYIHEGAYGTVYRARDNYTGKVHAIKKVKLNYEKEGFPISFLREIRLLQSLNHPNIINLKEVVTGKSPDQVFLVMDYAEHELKDLIQNYNYNFSISEIKSLMKQMLEALAYLHSKDIVHRDLKTSNLLYTREGLLKVCDFGLSRKMKGSKCSYTPTVVTLAYRAPEVLLGCDNYTSAVDMWSVGCIFAELLQGEPLFRAKGEMEQIYLIFRTLGTPTTTAWPGWKELKFSSFFESTNYTVNTLCNVFEGLGFGEENSLSDEGIDLLEQLLAYDPSKRITAVEALKHPWFSENPFPKVSERMPVFPETNDTPRHLGHKVFVNNSRIINYN